jgi:hypothetical protein
MAFNYREVLDRAIMQLRQVAPIGVEDAIMHHRLEFGARMRTADGQVVFPYFVDSAPVMATPDEGGGQYAIGWNVNEAPTIGSYEFTRLLVVTKRHIAIAQRSN